MHTRDDFLFFPDVLFPYYNKIEFDTAKVTNSICISCASFDMSIYFDILLGVRSIRILRSYVVAVR